MFLSTNIKVTTGVWNSEVGSRKSMEKAEGNQLYPYKYKLYFYGFEIQLFLYFHSC